MRVVISGYIGKKITGIGRNLICLLDNASSDVEYIIYTNCDMKKEFKFKNPHVTVKEYPISKNDSMKNLLWTTFVFPRKVKKEKADIALIPNFTLLLSKKAPTAVIIHDLIEFNVSDKFSPLKMFYRTKIADPSMVRNSDGIITVSENSKRDLIHFLKAPKEKIRVINNGVNQEVFHRMDTEKASAILNNRGWPTKFILYAGTLDHPGKNAMGVIKSFEELKKSGSYSGQLVLAGMAGNGYSVLKEYVDKSAYKNQIVFTGFVSDEELVALYSMCETFVFVSLYEGFGIPPLEALACGAKVVVSNTSSLPEVVGSVGITVDPTNQKAISDAILKSLNTSSDDEFTMKVCNHLKKYNWKHLSREFEEAILSLSE